MRLAAINTYPVKGCRRLDHDTLDVEPWGLSGDRRWLVVDPGGVGITQRDNIALVGLSAVPRPGGLRLNAPGLPELDVPEPTGGDPVEARVFRGRDSVRTRAAGPAADEWLGRLLGEPARLVWLGDPAGNPIPDPTYPLPVNFADGFPVLLANAASLDSVNEWLLEAGSPEGPLPMSRFRANLVVAGAAPWAEQHWARRRLRIGPVVFRAAEECWRCVVATIDQDTGDRGAEPLRVLGRHRNVNQKLLFGLHLIPESTGTLATGDQVEPLFG